MQMKFLTLFILSIIATSSFALEINFVGKTNDVHEGMNRHKIHIELSEASTRLVVVNYVVEGSSTFPDDHNLQSGTITFIPGQVTSAITVNIVKDDITEPVENFSLRLASARNATIGEFNEYFVNIYDTPPLITPVLGLQEQLLILKEGDVAKIDVVLSTEALNDVVLSYEISGSAEFPQDHNIRSSTLTIPAGSTSASIYINLKNDQIAEATDEFLRLKINGTISNAILSESNSIDIYILGDNPSPLMITDESFSTNEDNAIEFNLKGAIDEGAELLSYNLTTTVDNGVLSGCLDGSDSLQCLFTPNENFNGSIEFSYNANDGHQDSIQDSLIRINIRSINDRPISPDNYSVSTQVDTQLDFILSEGLDVDQDNLEYFIIKEPSFGQLINCNLVTNLQCTYLPETGFSGLDSFRYIVYDGQSYSLNATNVDVNVGSQINYVMELH
jgi:hypothetical protein